MYKRQEFIGRVPITVSLEALDRDALIRILKEPKNSLIKQYTKPVSYTHLDVYKRQVLFHFTTTMTSICSRIMSQAYTQQ